MDGRELREEVLRFDPELPIERAWTPPASWYREQAFWELERRALFPRSWQPVARVAELAEPGAWRSGCFAGEPWLVVRGADGVLRAFHNACRHKGREVVVGAGRDDELVCGYHAWRYGLDGRLRSAPRMAGILDFEREEMSLVPLRVATFGPWVFVCMDAGAPELAPRVAPVAERLARSGWERLAFHSSARWELACNWKVYVDNYLDGGYHIPHMHPSLDAQIDMARYRTEIFEACSLQGAPPSGAKGGGEIGFDARERIGAGAIYAWIHPNFMLNRYGPCLDTNHVVPLGPDRCAVVYEFYFLEEEGAAAREFLEASIEQSAVTQREDIAICESVQVGLGSRAYDRGRYAPRVEIGEHHFHRLLAAEYRRALELPAAESA